MTQANDTTPWAQTHSGRAFPLIDPTPSDVHWPDIAYALAHLNRFAGHAGAYSVAQHSIVVASILPREWRAYGLVHDAKEFVINDTPTPAKRAQRMCAERWAGKMGGQCVDMSRELMEGDIDAAIYESAGLIWPVPGEIDEAVHIADVRAMVTEKRDLLLPAPRPWGFEHVAPLKDPIVPWAWPERSFDEFMRALAECGIGVS